MFDSNLGVVATEPRQSAVAVGLRAKSAKEAKAAKVAKVAQVIDVAASYDSFNPGVAVGVLFLSSSPPHLSLIVCVATGFATDDKPLTWTRRSKKPRRASKGGNKRNRDAKSGAAMEPKASVGFAFGHQKTRHSRNGGFVCRANFARVDEWSTGASADVGGACSVCVVVGHMQALLI